jgi:hypothetical protein
MSFSRLKRQLFFGIIAAFLISSMIKLFPFETLKSNETAGNPDNCMYYFTLQSVLASYPLMAEDKANIRMIKKKLTDFEHVVKRSPNKTNATLQKATSGYFASLAQFNLQSIRKTNNEALILAIAKQNAVNIDNYYLDRTNFCISPLYNWYGPIPSRRVLRFNLAGLYDHLPNKFSRILPAVHDDWLTGSNPGFYLVNQTTTLDARFMTAMPLVTALYLLPKYDFNAVGTYGSPANWNYFRANSFIDPVTRKVLDVGGIDVFTVYNDDLGSKVIPGVEPLPNKLNPVFSSYYTYTSFINDQSYGTAYLANHISIEDPKTIDAAEKSIKHYFARHDDPAAFKRTTDGLYQKLMTLQQKHDVLLETTTPLRPGLDLTKSATDAVQIKGMVGGRNLFTSHCAEQNCLFVFNLTKSSGWYAYVNGVSTKIDRVNLAFMATVVPGGDATVWFIYSPWSWTITYFITMLTLLGVVLLSSKRGLLNS